MNQPLLVGFVIVLGLAAAWTWWRLGGWRRLRWRRGIRRAQLEDGLKYLFRCSSESRQASLEGMAGALQLPLETTAELVQQLRQHNQLELGAHGMSLTAAGERRARQLVQAHRLWEVFLADRTGFPERDWHQLADEQEHALDADQVEALSRRLGHPTHDPHGDPIPRIAGDPVAAAGSPLTAAPTNTPLRVMHVEDEPASVYNQLLQAGLTAGVELELKQVDADRVQIDTGHGLVELNRLAAGNVLVAPWPDELARLPAGAIRLCDLPAGGRARLVAIGPHIRKLERRRLMDLGLLPGTAVESELSSPGGDPTAYRVRETLIALRRDQTKWIFVEPMREAAA